MRMRCNCWALMSSPPSGSRMVLLICHASLSVDADAWEVCHDEEDMCHDANPGGNVFGETQGGFGSASIRECLGGLVQPTATTTTTTTTLGKAWVTLRLSWPTRHNFHTNTFLKTTRTPKRRLLAQLDFQNTETPELWLSDFTKSTSRRESTLPVWFSKTEKNSCVKFRKLSNQGAGNVSGGTVDTPQTKTFYLRICRGLGWGRPHEGWHRLSPCLNNFVASSTFISVFGRLVTLG